jgi:hypothetical protein
MIDITRATTVDQQAADAIQDLFAYHPLDQDQKARGDEVRHALVAAVTTIIEHVPPCPDRSSAIRKLRECRMDCMSAITHRGKY